MGSLHDNSTTGTQSNDKFSINNASQGVIRGNDTSSLMKFLEKGAMIDASLESSHSRHMMKIAEDYLPVPQIFFSSSRNLCKLSLKMGSTSTIDFKTNN